MFNTYRNKHASLYDQMKIKNFKLYLNTPVTKIERLKDGKLSVFAADNPYAANYDAVILTAPSWALQMNTKLSGFSENQLGFDIVDDLNNSHWLSSCKIFVPLNETYWTDEYVPGTIPQVICTDTFLRDIYAYRFNVKGEANDHGVLLLSYTWEDDATKIGSYSDAELVQRALARADEMLESCVNIGKKISDYVDRSKQPVVVHWEREPYIQGCAKTYRSRKLRSTYRLLRYNQDRSYDSGLYLAGEGFSVDGGWTEPAYRMALDAVIHLANKFGATFTCEDFSFDKYPKYIDLGQ
jgi:tryptophan 2-monooxygenase